jgi:SAM-dependent methyltransferase
MEIDRKTCAICNNNLNNIYSFKHVPIILSCVENVEDFKYSNMSFSKCFSCNTIQLDKLIPLEILYFNSHNYNSVGETWKGYFEIFNKNIKLLIENKNILEIGCPSGKIALLNNNYNKWIIVEPNKNNSIEFNEKIIFIEKFFDDKLIINDKIDIIIHSHLFEHMYEPNNFLKKCYEILDDNGEMFFGVPNMQYLSEKNLNMFLGVFFEHTIFLNKDNISYLLNKNGFNIIEIYDYVNHSTLYHVKKVKMIENIPLKIITNYYDTFQNTLNDFSTYVNFCNNFIKNSDKKIYIFGASCNTQLLLSLGVDNSKITGILDNCKIKQGKYLYGYNLKIYDPEITYDEDSIVILKNGYYSEEIRTQLKKININTYIL